MFSNFGELEWGKKGAKREKMGEKEGKNGEITRKSGGGVKKVRFSAPDQIPISLEFPRCAEKS